ncbi:MAG: cofactor-independent phosphoglycerate mutase [Phycisphaerales bacterium]|nr:cofactor-independent phosphoglycerate mutase [Phycisphaerales bacterium]
MKYVIIIPDGAADHPIPELNDQTPFEAATTPNLDRLGRMGRQGTVATTPPGFGAGSDVCCMTLFGYDAGRYPTGRAPLEAAALGLTPAFSDWIFRLNLVTTGEDDSNDGLMIDHSAGHITDAEARLLLTDLRERWADVAPDLASSLSLTNGVSYRHILIDSAHGYDRLETTPPHEIPGQPWERALPRGEGSERLRMLMDLSREVFAEHDVNRARREAGLRPATMAWIWGQGTPPQLPTFEEKYGLRACIITAVDLLAGIAAYAGWDRIPVPGITGYHDTDYAAKGRYACAALDRYDLVIVHVEAPDEASHQGDWSTKVASIEAIDEHIVGPLLTRLQACGDIETDPEAEGWRMLVAPDHYTLVDTRRHDATPPPFVMAGGWVRSVVHEPFSERAASEADLHVDPGDGLMEYFLFSGRNLPRQRRSADA